MHRATATGASAKLMPMKDGIIELRQKGASIRLISELLATAGVAVGTDTIARFSPRWTANHNRHVLPNNRLAYASQRQNSHGPTEMPRSHLNDCALAPRASQILATSDQAKSI